MTLTQEVNPSTDAPKIKPFTDNLQNLINTYGFTKIQFNPEQIKNYLVKKVDININLIKFMPDYTAIDSNIIIQEIMVEINKVIQDVYNLPFKILSRGLLIPINKQDNNYTFLIPTIFFIPYTGIIAIDSLFKSLNPDVPNEIISKMNAFYNTFQTSINPQISYINFISTCILSMIMTVLPMLI